MKEPHSITCDLLIVGSGLAGLWIAHHAFRQGSDVLIVSKGKLGKSGSSVVAMPGYAAAIGHGDPRDNTDVHLEDTVRAGCGIGSKDLINILCTGAIEQLMELEFLGVGFEKGDGKFVQYKGAGHTYPRSCCTVEKYHQGLIASLSKVIMHSGIRIIEKTSCLDLIKKEDKVCGALCLSEIDGFILVGAKCVVIATGGVGQIYKYTSNPKGLFGEGVILAYDAGAGVVDLEFVQFRPYRIISPPILNGINLASSTFEYGGTVRNINGNDLIEIVEKSGRVPTRDEVSRLIAKEVFEGRGIRGGVRADLSSVSESMLLKLNPRLRSVVNKKRINFSRDEVIVFPEAHYMMGGIKTDKNGFTNIPGLYAVGEVVGGIHGANRLQDNAIPELFVFGKRAALSAVKEGSDEISNTDISFEGYELIKGWRNHIVTHDNISNKLSYILEQLRVIMWKEGGLIRSEMGLNTAIDRLQELQIEIGDISINSLKHLVAFAEVKRGLEVAMLICLAARDREESRGAHTRLDFPFQLDGWRKSIGFYRGSDTS